MAHGSDDLVDIVKRFIDWSDQIAGYNSFRHAALPWEVDLPYIAELMRTTNDAKYLIANAPGSE